MSLGVTHRLKSLLPKRKYQYEMPYAGEFSHQVAHMENKFLSSKAHLEFEDNV